MSLFIIVFFNCFLIFSRVCKGSVFDRDCFVSGVGDDISEIDDTTFYVLLCF